MHAYTLTGQTLRDAFKQGVLPRHPAQEGGRAGLRTVKARFNVKVRPNTHAVLKTLTDGESRTRLQISKAADIGLGAARHEAERLVKEGRLQWTIDKGAFRYQLVNRQTQVIRQKNGVLARRCGCKEYVRLRRYKGTYVFRCTKCQTVNDPTHKCGGL